MWDELKSKLGLGGGDEKRELRELLAKSEQTLSELESEQQELEAREAELSKAGPSDDLARVQASLSAIKELRESTRISHERVKALLGSSPSFDTSKLPDLSELATKAKETAKRALDSELASKAKEVGKRALSQARELASKDLGELWTEYQAGPGAKPLGQRLYRAAITECDAALVKNPKNWKALHNRGMARVNLGQTKEALPDFDAVLSIVPSHAPSRIMRGAIRHDEDDVDGALSDAKELVRVQPNLPGGHWLMALALESKRDLDAALRETDEALRLRADDAAYHTMRSRILTRLGRYDAALSAANEAVRIGPLKYRAFDARAHAQLGRLAYDAALSDLDEALRLNPLSTESRHLKVHILRQRDDPSASAEAAEFFRRCPEPAGAHAWRATWRFEDLDYDAARADIREALRLDERCAHALRLRARLAARLGDLEAAKLDYTRAVELDAENGGAFAGRAYARFALGDVPGAFEDAAAAIRRDPSAGSTHGNLLWLVGDFDGAGAAFDDTLAREPHDFWALTCRARLRLVQGHVSEGLEDLRLARRVKPSDAFPPIWLVAFGDDPAMLEPFAAKSTWRAHLARLVLGRHTEASVLEEASRAASDYERRQHLCEAHCFLGILAERSGDATKAQTHFEACVATEVHDYQEYAWARTRLVQFREREPLADNERLAKLADTGVLSREEVEQAQKLLEEKSKKPPA